MRNILYAVEVPNLIDSIDVGRETSVKTEELPVDGGCEWKILEEVGEHLPDVLVAVLLDALLVEAVQLVNLSE